MAHTLKPFRDYSEHDVINLFSYSGDQDANGLIASRGTVVKIVGSGFMPVAVPNSGLNGTNPVDLVDGLGATYANTVSTRWGVTSKVSAAVSGENAIGITLLDVRELDENGEKLVFNPRKAAEMNVVVSGQSVPVLTRGVISYSGTQISPVNPGAGVYLGTVAGELSTTDNGAGRVGTLLSRPYNGQAIIRVNF
jgi:hypothetical protein